jgi:uracil-DNA glycosylase
MTIHPFHFNLVHPSWKECLPEGLAKINPSYLEALSQSSLWLPGPEKIFNALSLPLNNVKYVLFGESPYPRPESANGYAFWDASVKNLWSPTGLSKEINRATSMRNILKMLLIAEGLLDPDHTSQPDIAELNKASLIQTNDDLFAKLINNGFLLLNATPVLQPGPPAKDAKAWNPFMKVLLNHLIERQPEIEFILLGRIAVTIDALIPNPKIKKLYAEHPYNLSFITNKQILDFFKPLHLLRKG